MRDAARELALHAAEAGMPSPWRLTALTPREIELEMKAHASRQQQALERIDLAAWLAGRYASQGFHAPRRYPRRPEAVRHRQRAMTDAQIKRTFAALAAGRSEEDGSC